MYLLILIASILSALPAFAASIPAHYPAPYTCNRNFFVSTGGSDSANCSQATPCASMQGANNNIALTGGDCVNFLAGTYNVGSMITFTKGGNANSAGGYVSYVGAPNHGTIMHWTGSTLYGLKFQAGTAYYMIDGIVFDGNNNTVQDMMFATGDSQNHNNLIDNGNINHHIWLINNIIHGNGAGVFYPAYGDYYVYAGNEVYNAMNLNNYGSSGFGVYESIDMVAHNGFTASLPWDTQYYHIQILNNYVHDSALTQSGSPAGHSDGNGAEIDDEEFDQWTATNNSNRGPNPGTYPYHILVAGNIFVHNGGRGLAWTDSCNVDAYNNTTYNNGGDPSGFKAEMNLGGCNNNVVNNLMYAFNGGATFLWGTAYGASETGNTVHNNLVYNGTASDGVTINDANAANDTAYFQAAAQNNKRAVDPKLVNVGSANYYPVTGTSPVIGAGAPLPTQAVLPNAIVSADGTPFSSPPPIGALNAGGVNSVAGPISIGAGSSSGVAPFVFDQGFNGGTAATDFTGAIDTHLLTGTVPPQAILQAERYGSAFSYVINNLAIGANYSVVFYFQEAFDTAAGQRHVNVTINGTNVLNNIDIFQAAGGQHIAVAYQFTIAPDSTGTITIAFAGDTTVTDQNAKVDALQVLASANVPVAANQSTSTALNTPVNVQLDANATNNPTSAAIVGTPVNGTVTLSGLVATFTPASGFSGTGSFQFTLSNAAGVSNTATATIAVSSGVNAVAGPVSVGAGETQAFPPFVQDAGFNGGTTFCCGTNAVNTSLLAAPIPPISVFLGQRFGPSFYYLVTGLNPSAQYNVTFYFTEDNDTAVGQRQVNVAINGTSVLSAFDIFAAAGAQNKAVSRTFVQTPNASGQMNIAFTGTAGQTDPNAKIDAFSVLPVNQGGVCQ